MVVLGWYQKERLYSIDVVDAHVPHRLHVFLTSLAYHTLYSQNWVGDLVKNSQAWCYTSCSCLELCVGAWLCCNTKKFRKHCCHIPVFIVWATDTLADRWVILKSHGLRFGRSNSGKCCGYVGSVRLACGSVIKCLLVLMSHRFATLGVGDFGPGPGASLPPFGMLTRIRTCKTMHPDSMPFQQKVWDTFGTPMLTQWDRILESLFNRTTFFDNCLSTNYSTRTPLFPLPEPTQISLQASPPKCPGQRHCETGSGMLTRISCGPGTRMEADQPGS